jgi:bifunctional non-homologous end joining protein LigD
MAKQPSANPRDDLGTYRAKRDFSKTAEPPGRKTGERPSGAGYLIQKHAARRLHYDLRLELDGVLKSWAVTKGPSLNPQDKRLAVRTEDHPLDYGTFEGTIPKGEYGGGTVMLWDKGTWLPQSDPHEGLERGVLKFELNGERLRGGFALVRLKNGEGDKLKRGKSKKENWLLIKEKDALASQALEPVEIWTSSVATRRGMAEISRAAQTPAPELQFIAPQLATLRSGAPAGDKWLHEIKYDGYRVIAVAHGSRVTLFTRSQKDWTDKFPNLVQALGEMQLENTVIDGEIVVLNAKGQSRFSLLQKALKNRHQVFVLYAFDLLRLKGRDLRKQPQLERKQMLQALLENAPPVIRYSDHQRGSGPEVLAQACRMGLEGTVSKRIDAVYRSARTHSWIKSKCSGREDFVIGAYRPSPVRGRPFSSLLLGEYVNGKLQYRGRVGTGFDQHDMAELATLFRGRESQTSPFVQVPPEAREARWLEPNLIAEIKYVERTHDNHLRHPVYLGLREDLSEDAMPDETEHDAAAKEGNTIGIRGVRLSNPDKVLYPVQGISKRDLAEYLVSVRERLLPHAARRPLTLVRCPQGRTRCFFQKHYTATLPPGIQPVDIVEKSKQSTYVYIEDLTGLLSTAQIGVLELHLWGSRIDTLQQPDRLVFDLDPDESLDFSVVKDAAVRLRELLAAANLRSFPLLTGGKGIHLVIPLTPRHEWLDVKRFARGIARGFAQQFPQEFVATASKAKRNGKIFIDWMRNERGATAISPYATRAKENCPIAAPVSWRELPHIRAASQYNISNMAHRLESLQQDPWEDYFSMDQTIPAGALAMFR